MFVPFSFPFPFVVTHFLLPLLLHLTGSRVHVSALAFTPQRPYRSITATTHHRHNTRSVIIGSSSVDSNDNDKNDNNNGDTLSLLDEIRSMRVKELKAELTKQRIATSDVFDKEELVKRLYDARMAASITSITDTTRSGDEDDDDDDENVIRGDIYFTPIETGRSIDAINSETIRIDGSSSYPTITIHVHGNNNNNNNSNRRGEGCYDLTLLLDTACSGFVLRPSTVQKYAMKLLGNNPVTMTGAGGIAGKTGLVQIKSFSLSGDNNNNNNFGPLPAAVQDIGALPSSLDGIIGLSFLNRYACTEIDLKKSKLKLYKTERIPPIPEGYKIVTDGELSPTRLGIWTANVMLDGRGPIKMLIDTGATSSFVNWKGIEDGLGLTRTSPQVHRLEQRTGALGSDNIAMVLTHRLEVASIIKFGGIDRSKRRQQQHQTTTDDGISIPTTAATTTSNSAPLLSVDIGDIAILDTQLAEDRVVGILGMDFFSKCSMIRMNLNGPIPKISLFVMNDTNDVANNKGEDDKNEHDGNDNNSPSTSTSTSTSGTTGTSTVTDTSTTSSNPEPKKKKKKRRY